MNIGDNMKRGFTLVELLGVIALLAVLFLFVYPNVLDIAEQKEKDIDQAKVKLINNAAVSYMNSHLNDYPQTIGTSYCILIDTLDNEALIPVDVNDIEEKYNYIRVKIGANNTYSYQYIQADTNEKCLQMNQ